MKKYTIKKTYIPVKDRYLFHIFGLDGENNPLVITQNNIDYLQNHVQEYVEETSNPNVLAFLTNVEKELETVNEVQFIKED